MKKALPRISIISLIVVNLAGAAVSAAPAAAKKNVEESFHFEQKLRRYGWLEKKVFLSVEETSDRTAIVKDVELLKSLGHFLTRPSETGSGRQLMQNYAVDLLIESLMQNASGDAASKATLESLQEIARNPEIEHEHGWYSEHARKSVAGFKGEILYRWSSAQPDQAPTISALLPGPVSRKIWNNVQLMQSENSHLSAATVATKMSRSH